MSEFLLSLVKQVPTLIFTTSPLHLMTSDVLQLSLRAVSVCDTSWLDTDSLMTSTNRTITNAFMTTTCRATEV